MERRYLVAALALIATFAIFSREFRSGRLDKLPRSRAELQADVNCAKRYVAEQLAEKVRPLVDRGVPEEAQMVAELNLPVLAAVNEKIAEAQAAAAQKTAEKKYDTVVRAQETTLRAQQAVQRAEELSARAAERAQELSERANQRAQEISQRANERAQELSIRANERAAEINMRMIEHARQVSDCASERTQRAMERSRATMTPPQAPSLPMHINFEVMAPPDFALPEQAAMAGRHASESVKAQVAAQQIRMVTVQRANQKIVNDVQVVVTRQDLSGGQLAQLSAARAVSRQIERAIQHFLQNLLRTLERTFATI
jgi:hypothetical protein